LAHCNGFGSRTLKIKRRIKPPLTCLFSHKSRIRAGFASYEAEVELEVEEDFSVLAEELSVLDSLLPSLDSLEALAPFSLFAASLLLPLRA
jgi:hypothetical protein